MVARSCRYPKKIISRSPLADVDTFLQNLQVDQLCESDEKGRSSLARRVAQISKKVEEQLQSSSVNGIKSPRPTRKSCPAGAIQDSLHTYASHLHKIASDVGQRRSLPGSPEIKRGKPAMRPRSASCPEIRFTLPHSWKISLAKVPENEELKVDADAESSDD